MATLHSFQLPLAPAPLEVLQAAAAGIIPLDFPPPSQAHMVLGANRDLRNQILRAPNGTALVTCITDLPGVTPTMIDWWFGWHMTESERYRLWHPTAHIASSALEDRSSLRDPRAQYIDNISYVDEYIGPSLKKLAIAFKSPRHFGFSTEALAESTAICAETFDRKLKSRGGYLVHYVVPTPNGSQMRSGFWLGYIDSQIPGLGPLLNLALNTPTSRRALLQESFLQGLLTHCGEEMNHLGKFLPKLFTSHNTMHSAPHANQ